MLEISIFLLRKRSKFELSPHYLEFKSKLSSEC